MRTCIHCIVYWTNCWIKLNSMRFIHSHKLTLHMSYFHILILFLSFFIVYLHFHFKIDIVLMMIINWLFSFLFFFISNLFLFFFLFLFSFPLVIVMIYLWWYHKIIVYSPPAMGLTPAMGFIVTSPTPSPMGLCVDSS